MRHTIAHRRRALFCNAFGRYDNATSTAVTDIYRTFASIHTALGPYLLATGAAAFESNSSAMTFTDDTTFLLGSDILVAPLLSNATNSRQVTFPAHGSWINWFTNETHAGGSSATVSAALNEFPVFKKAGSVIALDGAFAHHASAFDRSLSPASPPTIVFVITQPVSAGMTCVRRGAGSNRTAFIAEYSHDAHGFTVLSARKRGSQTVAFVMVIARHLFLFTDNYFDDAWLSHLTNSRSPPSSGRHTCMLRDSSSMLMARSLRGRMCTPFSPWSSLSLLTMSLWIGCEVCALLSILHSALVIFDRDCRVMLRNCSAQSVLALYIVPYMISTEIQS